MKIINEIVLCKNDKNYKEDRQNKLDNIRKKYTHNLKEGILVLTYLI